MSLTLLSTSAGLVHDITDSLPDTKWQRSKRRVIDFQTSTFNVPNHKSAEKKTNVVCAPLPSRPHIFFKLTS